MQPFSAEYWHIGAITIRFDNSSEPTWTFSKRAGRRFIAIFLGGRRCFDRTARRLLGVGIVLSAKDSLRATTSKASLVHGGADLSSRRPVAEPDIGKYDCATPANAKSEITCVRCSDAASQMFRTPGMTYGQTLAPSPPNEARSAKERRPVVLP